MAYADLLKDPRWQKRRLEILSRDNFTCQYCGADYMTLHVHHKAYSKQRMDPWSYNDRVLTTLCESCHSDVHSGMNEAIEWLGTGVKIAGLMPKDIRDIADSFLEMELQHAPEVIASAIKDTLLIPELQAKMIENFFAHLHEKSKNIKHQQSGEEIH